MARPVKSNTVQARVDAHVAAGERRGRVIADALGIRPEYARACVQRALQKAATGYRLPPPQRAADSQRKRELRAG